MKRKILFIPLALLMLSITMPTMAEANRAPFLEAEMEVFSVEVVVPGTEYYFHFEGVVGGPNVKAGTIEGVDHYIFDPYGTGHIDAIATITDKDGHIITCHIIGLNPPGNPSGAYYPFVDAMTTVTGATGKYEPLVESTFIVEGFFSDLNRLHMIWYYP